MPVIDTVLGWLPTSIQKHVVKHRELVKFAVVGGAAFIVDTAIFEGLKSTILSPKPVTAKVISTLIATIVSYIFNREWSFSTRGGLRRRYEAGLFFLVSAIGLALNAAPLGLSRYVFDLQTPDVSKLTQELADFASAQIIGTLIAMVFRYWAFRRFVFPAADVRPRRSHIAVASAGRAGDAAVLGVQATGALGTPTMGGLDVDEIAADMLGDPWPFGEPDDELEADTQDLPMLDPHDLPRLRN